MAHPVAPHAHILMPFTQNEEDEIAEVEKFKEMEDLDGMLTMLMMLIMLMMLMLVFVIVMQWCSDDDDDDEDGLFVTAPIVIAPQGGCACKKTNYIFSLSNIWAGTLYEVVPATNPYSLSIRARQTQ